MWKTTDRYLQQVREKLYGERNINFLHLICHLLPFLLFIQLLHFGNMIDKLKFFFGFLISSSHIPSVLHNWRAFLSFNWNREFGSHIFSYLLVNKTKKLFDLITGCPIITDTSEVICLVQRKLLSCYVNSIVLQIQK